MKLHRDLFAIVRLSLICLSWPVGVVAPAGAWAADGARRPNFLWITTEDNGPRQGCYGDALAKTPHTDALAAKGAIYTNAFANAPVCAPARFTIFTSRYAAAMGNEGMRSHYTLPATLRGYTHHLREAGYYCTNHTKTDYNYDVYDPVLWDATSRKGAETPDMAHYRNRKPGQPFFHVYSDAESHEWKIWNLDNEPIRTDPAKVTVPPYLPDTSTIRMQLARNYDMIENADKNVGRWLAELEASGLAEDTIIFLYGDHGGVFPRTKRYLYDTGTRVPLVIHIPEKFRQWAPGAPGSKIDRLVSFVDFAPTILSLAGIDIPGETMGNAFLGLKTAPEPEDVFLFRGRMGERIDLSRALRTKTHRYIRNYMPHRTHGLWQAFMFRQISYGDWQKEFEAGRCNPVQSAFWQPKAVEELYDIAADPWEIKNLAGDPAQKRLLEELRARLDRRLQEMGDVGLLTEIRAEAAIGGKSLREAVDAGEIPLARVAETAELAKWGDPKNLPELTIRLADREPEVGYWAATGCVAMGKASAPAKDALLKALESPSWAVRIPAAEALSGLGERGRAVPILLEALDQPLRTAMVAANALANVDASEPLPKDAVDRIVASADKPRGHIRPSLGGKWQPNYEVKALLWHIAGRHGRFPPQPPEPAQPKPAR